MRVHPICRHIVDNACSGIVIECRHSMMHRGLEERGRIFARILLSLQGVRILTMANGEASKAL